jgi:hypothetical protein
MANHLTEALILANKDFNLDIPETEVSTAEDFQEILAKLVRHLLDNDFERLLNGLYRIDVSEEKVKLAMASSGDLAEEIAMLIIEREMQKVETRREYRK